ncbi:phosphotransferase [Pseudonocardia sp. RS010]|uniref:phosphotransferase n=1 Tax=Pseudonocardia sp. RS010 TaxID=3385979 RepID=UPI0039A2BFC7
MRTPEEIAARAQRAAAAAAGAGRAVGLPVEEPTVLYDVFSVVVRLDPAPVVARVPTVLPPVRPPDVYAQQQRELAVAGWLASAGHPVACPSPLVPAVPMAHDGHSVTFWERLEVLPSGEPSPADLGTGLARLHSALRDCPVSLPVMAPLDASIPAMLEWLKGRPDLLDPADLARARREWAVLGPFLTSPGRLAARGTPVQPIHGDAPTYNVLRTPTGSLDSDFEHACLGAVEWDLAFVGTEVLDAYDAAAPRPADRELVRLMEAGRMIQLVACHAMGPELPSLVEGLRPVLASWRATPEVTDVDD